jgi:hypothetical protein
MPLTQPDNIYFADNLTPMSASVISASEASSVQAAFSNFRDEVANQLENLPPFAAQCSRTGSGIVTGLTQNVYQTTGLSGTLDSGLNSLSPDFVLGATDALGLRNNSSRTRLVYFYASADCTSANNQNLGIKMALNGTAIDETECRAFTSGSNAPAKLATSWIVSLSPASEVSIFLANFSGTNNIDVQRARVIGHAIV